MESCELVLEHAVFLFEKDVVRCLKNKESCAKECIYSQFCVQSPTALYEMASSSLENQPQHSLGGDSVACRLGQLSSICTQFPV